MTITKKLTERKIIRLSGAESESFLQALITQDITLLAKQPVVYSLLLSPQGKAIVDFFIFKDSQDFYLDVPSVHSELLYQKLRLYRLRKPIEIEQDNSWQVLFSASSATIDAEKTIESKDPRFTQLGYRIYCQNLVASLPEGDSEYNQLRLKLTVPDHRDLGVEESFPLEFGLDHLNAFSFTKGCFVGQEVSTRTKHLGVVRKQPMQASADTELASLEGQEVTIDGNKVGKICSAHGKLALALIRKPDYEQHYKPSSQIMCEDKAITLSQPSWLTN